MKVTLLLAAGTLVAAQTAIDGNAILARAAAAPGLSSYSVPVHFDVRMHRPIGIGSGADGVIYYKAPARSALAITHIPGPIGRFFKGSYTIDLAAQTWAKKYTVVSVTQSQSNGTPTYVLQAVPKSDPSVDRVVFGVTQSGYEPVSTVWHYRDGSSVSVSIQNQRMNGYALPNRETISVSMPKYALDATATYGTYAVNGPVPDSVFSH